MLAVAETTCIIFISRLLPARPLGRQIGPQRVNGLQWQCMDPYGKLSQRQVSPTNLPIVKMLIILHQIIRLMGTG